MNTRRIILALGAFACFANFASAQLRPDLQNQNWPLVQTKFTPDPAPMVYNDTVFLYTGHDEDDAGGFSMHNWLLYTSTDMVNWTDHGAIATIKDFKWFPRDNGAWAAQCIHRNGKFYLYCPLHGNGIGVLVADSPYGPFKDPIGKPIVWQREHWEDIDPTVWIDDDGQAYLYWGNPNVYWVKLNEDMISYSGEIHKLDYKIKEYQEAPWFYKHNGHYYLAFASTCCPEGIGYAMSDSPTGPWEYKGAIMDHTPRTNGNHPGIIEYKGNSYVFGFSYDIMKITETRHHERRSVCASKMEYNADGTIKTLPYWLDQKPLDQLEWLNPFKIVQAETMAWGYGLKTKPCKSGICVTDIDEGECIRLRGVDFGTGIKRFYAMTAANKNGGMIELRADSFTGPLLGILGVGATGSLDTYSLNQCPVGGIQGIHDLYLKFHCTDDTTFNFDWWVMR
ncbi:MAG: glycoside hydrolase family 43 protein [Bacteroidaceae bacterium]|nr:glycoside hydrolase family 43 protein [Bacteroidaceae bacterium]